MLLPLNWLKQYVDVTETPEQVAERFLGLGFEAEMKTADIIDLDVTPNRGDALSIIGLAREYAAATGQELRMPEFAALNTVDKLPEFTLAADTPAYHRISATIVKGIKNQPSPDWLRDAVLSVGMNSIDVIVDLTNYVMFELGIPMHAFDLDVLPAHDIHVRLSTRGETFTSLKDETVELPENAVVVESGNEVIDLLGIRGGKSTMIQPTTQNIFVWAVAVPRPLIRQAVKATGIRTEGGYRHERETDWDMVPVALARFVHLLEQIAGGQAEDAMDLIASERPVKQIEYVDADINSLLGTNYSSEQIDTALNRLGFAVSNKIATVPSWRYFDVSLWQDLAEEVARIEGYAAIPRKIIARMTGPAETNYALVENLRDQLQNAGLTEVYTESFAGRQETKIAGWDEASLAVLANPVNQEFAFCRPTMIPNLIKLLALNSWSDDARVFEVGKVFPSKESEVLKVAIAAYGKQQKLFAQWVPAEAIQLVTPEDALGQHFKLRRPATVAEVEIDQLTVRLEPSYAVGNEKPSYQTVSVYPPSVRDISVIVDQSIDIDALIQSIKDISPEHILIVELFDQFASEKFGPNKQSLAFHIIYQSVEGTMETGQVDALHQQVIDLVTTQYGAEIR